MSSVAMSNFTYLLDYLEMVPHKNPDYFHRCLERMKIYDSNGDKWWITFWGNPVELAARQLDEEFLLIRMSDFAEGIKRVIGRSVSYGEISQKNKDLISEFKQKYPFYKAETRAV